MEIRKLTESNYADMTRLWIKASLPFKPKGRDSKERIVAEMKASPDFFLGAFEENRLVGAVIVSSDLRKGWINRLAVDPDYWHRGIAKALIAEGEKILHKRGLRIFCALIEESNVPSKELFHRCGYSESHDILYFSKRDSDLT
jgi:ribosomal protein S18 acetylase RimI-like enzyme